MSSYRRTGLIRSVTLFIVVLLLVGTTIFLKPEKTKAIDIAKGGSAIEVAVPITPGKYTGIPLAADEATFYSISVKAGQELKVTGSFIAERPEYGTINTVEIFNDDRKSLVSKFESEVNNVVSVSALADSSKATHTYYIKASDDTWGTASGELEVSLTDRFDANSGTDAGASIEQALTIKPGTHKGYISAVDGDDYYSVPAAKGNFSVRTTPSSKIIPTVEIYDQTRTKLAEQTADNAGQIFTLSADAPRTENLYLRFNCDINSGCESDASEYSFTTSTGTGEIVVPDDGGTGTGDITVPDGILTVVNSVVKPILEKIYETKIVVKEVNNNTIVYVAERNTKDNDLASIKAAMEGLGYKTKSISANKLVMSKGLKEVTFEALSDSNQIRVTVKDNTIYIWIGVAALVVILAIVLLIILLASRKKKSGTPAPVPPATEPATPAETATENKTEAEKPTKVSKSSKK